MLRAKRYGEPPAPRLLGRRRWLSAVPVTLAVLVGIVLVYWAYGLAYYVGNYDWQAQPRFHDSFETADLSAWTRNGATELCCPSSAAFVQGGRDGGLALRLTLS